MQVLIKMICDLICDLGHWFKSFLQMICDLDLWFDLWFAHHCFLHYKLFFIPSFLLICCWYDKTNYVLPLNILSFMAHRMPLNYTDPTTIKDVKARTERRSWTELNEPNLSVQFSSVTSLCNVRTFIHYRVKLFLNINVTDQSEKWQSLERDRVTAVDSWQLR